MLLRDVGFERDVDIVNGNDRARRIVTDARAEIARFEKK